jgi:TPR repeat protein
VLTKSANGGYAPAQETLGEMYLEGKCGLAQDAARGERLLLAAAEPGRSGPKLLLANLYASAKGSVKRGPLKAYMWYELVIREGDQTEDIPEFVMFLFYLSSNWLDATLAQQELEKTMTKAQVAEAIRKAAQWQKQHRKG